MSHPRGKLTGAVGKAYLEMTKKEKLAYVKESIRREERYISSHAEASKQAKQYLKNLKKLYKDLGGK